MKVLVADDDTDLVDLMDYALRREGYEVLTAVDGQQALARWQSERPDIVLLDGSMPKVDGFEVCRQIRHEGKTPVIMLTARRAEDDVIRGLQVGADDYVTKPFSAKQLIARMGAVLRRSQESTYSQVSGQLSIGDLALDRESHQVTKNNRPVQLTRLEFRILYMLAQNVGRVMPYSRLVEYGWGYYDETTSNLLKTHVSHIRMKLGLRVGGSSAIRAVLGVGYSFTSPASESSAAAP